MKGKYRIYVLGPLPPGLKDRISSVHADAILNSRRVCPTVNSQDSTTPVKQPLLTRPGEIRKSIPVYRVPRGV
jgi:hypothetical protein